MRQCGEFRDVWVVFGCEGVCEFGVGRFLLDCLSLDGWGGWGVCGLLQSGAFGG